MEEYKYKTFEDWFYEIESYSTRSERFYEDSTAELEDWLKAAFECGRLMKE